VLPKIRKYRNVVSLEELSIELLVLPSHHFLEVLVSCGRELLNLWFNDLVVGRLHVVANFLHQVFSGLNRV